VQFSLTFKDAEMQRAIDQLGAKAPRAIARALNRAAVSTRTVMASAVAKDTGLKVGTIREQLRIEQAKPVEGKLAARITVSGKRIPLIDFRARGPEPSRGRGRGVSARLPGGKGRYPHAFIATMKSGHRGVFQRRAQTRLPVYELHGPSLPHVFVKHIAVGLARGEESLAKNLAHELRFALRTAA
jgi:hypothetical protein